jgi:hypothetical protein
MRGDPRQEKRWERRGRKKQNGQGELTAHESITQQRISKSNLLQISH